MDKFLCPLHEEDTPSVVAYDSHAWCFGCSRKVELSALGIKPGEVPPPIKEHIPGTIDYISKLPKKFIRGLELPYDHKGYYLVWPDASYYKLRLYDLGDRSGRYVGPSGHKPPLLWARQTGSETLVICEGEINALSVALFSGAYDIVSPGSASNFHTKCSNSYLHELLKYDNFILVLDKDSPGARGGIELSSSLHARGKPKTKIVLVDPDFNDHLTTHAETETRQYIQACLGLRT